MMFFCRLSEILKILAHFIDKKMGFQTRFYNLGKLGKYTVFYIKFKEIFYQIYVFKMYLR